VGVERAVYGGELWCRWIVVVGHVRWSWWYDWCI
jgi:hypothetical protein